MRLPLLVLLLFFFQVVFAQNISDSVQLEEITVKAYLSERPVLRLPSSVSIIDSATMGMQNNQSLVATLNTAAGVRMEERSPGSYRLSIRGSLLRSPFGVRNVKVYMDEFPLTDAGGNTYINLLNMNLVKRIEILKGPDGSLFGANSGGVVRLEVFNKTNDSSIVSAGLNGGSFGLIQGYARVQYREKKNLLSVSQSWQQSDGYRENSNLRRGYFQLADQWNYSQKSQLRFLVFYSNLFYATPGGLNLTQFEKNPQAARPATSTLPGAKEQRAGIYNSTLYSGILNELALTTNTRIVTAVFGSHTDFKNPFITNYEVREEMNGGLRAWLETGNSYESTLQWKWNIGTEMQTGNAQITNYENNRGIQDTLLANSFLNASQGFVFTRFLVDINNRLQAEASVSYNMNSFTYRDDLQQLPSDKNAFKPQFMPRLALSYYLLPGLALRAIISKGYSPPTLAEVLSSGAILNRKLQPETGYNYETGLRFRDKKGYIWWDVVYFNYRLQQAIVRRVTDAGEEFFTNAGGTNQQGVESQFSVNLIRARNTGFIRHLKFSNSYTYNHFRFSNYVMELNNYSGNKLTGVPSHALVSGFTIHVPGNVYVFVQHNYTSSIPLNDANTASADAYNLIQAKAGWKFNINKKFNLELHVGADNLLNERYSLGNDLNAAAGRYYNAAPPRNYYAGIALTY